MGQDDTAPGRGFGPRAGDRAWAERARYASGVMAISADGCELRIQRLRADLADQGERVRALLERAVDAAFDCDEARARAVIADDDAIDRVDVQIEKAVVALLTEATRDGAAMTERQLRLTLTIAKVNNELERIADSGVNIAEQSRTFARLGAAPPETFRVMANSVIGILQHVNRSLATCDARSAEQALASDDATLAFKAALLRDIEEGVACGKKSVDIGFALQLMASELDRISDHCTNIAEQVIYVETGAIVRHSGGKWTAPTLPR